MRTPAATQACATSRGVMPDSIDNSTAGAEKLARDLLVQGADGMKAADLQGVDALLIIKDGKKFRTEMAGGFKEQYGKAKKK